MLITSFITLSFLLSNESKKDKVIKLLSKFFKAYKVNVNNKFYNLILFFVKNYVFFAKK